MQGGEAMSEYIISIPDTYINSNELPQHIRVNSLNLQEIVRCRDCMYLANIGYWCAHPLQSFIDEYGMELNHKAEPNSFCSWGERKMDA